MSSKDRKHSSKEPSRKPKSSSGGVELATEREASRKAASKDNADRKESSDKKRIATDKESDRAKDKADNEKSRHRRDREGEGRDQATDNLHNDIKKAYKTDKDHDKDRQRRSDHADKTRHRTDQEAKRVDKSRTKHESTDNGDKARRRGDDRVDEHAVAKAGRHERDGDKHRHHRSDKGDLRDDRRDERKDEERRRRREKEKREKERMEKERTEKERIEKKPELPNDDGRRHKTDLAVRDSADRDVVRETRPSGDTGAGDHHRSKVVVKDHSDATAKRDSASQKSDKMISAVDSPHEVVADPHVAVEEELDDYDVEDDFEDDDGDGDGDGAQQHEMTAVATTSTGTSTSSSRRSSLQQPQQLQQQPTTAATPALLGPGSFINFRMAQQRYSRDTVANKMLARAFDLSRLIDMDRVAYDIIEMAPVLEHGQYMRMIGRDGIQHEASQTRDDNVGRESQTELIEERVVWTQCPPVDDALGAGYGSTDIGKTDGALSVSAGDSALTTLSDIPVASLMHVLTLFERLLDEEATLEIGTSKQSSSGEGPVTIGSGCHSYPVSSSRTSSDAAADTSSYCTMARFAPGNSNMFVTVTAAPGPSNESTDSGTVSTPLTVWKVAGGGGDKPLVRLNCPFSRDAHRDICAVAFSPDSAASHVICGLASGAIALWDLRERAVTATATREQSLSPAYLTSSFSEDHGIDDCHEGPIVALQSVAAATGNQASSSYQLISLDALAQLLIWAVSALSTNQSIGQYSLASGSVTDLNLRPGARYRLTLVASLSLTAPGSAIGGGALGTSLFATSMAVDPARSANLFVGTIGGQVLQHVRTTNQATSRTTHANSRSQKQRRRPRCHPRKILGETDSFEAGAVTQLDFYPFFEPYVLAGYNDGLIRIFDSGTSKVLLSFCYKQNTPILQLRWSRSHPAIFFSLDADGNLCVWNVLVNTYQPVHVEQLRGFIGFDLSSDSRWQIKDKNSTNNKARLLLWAIDGRVEVHDLSDIFSNPDLDASFRTCSLFQSLI